MADRPTRTPTDLERRLHVALRAQAIVQIDDRFNNCRVFHCKECVEIWNTGQPERHAPGCLAAPGALGDER